MGETRARDEEKLTEDFDLTTKLDLRVVESRILPLDRDLQILQYKFHDLKTLKIRSL